ncbi:MAG: phenylalanine--tRNA ligase subunit alpha [bacterium]
MENKLKQLLEEARKEIDLANNHKRLTDLKIKYLGRNGELTQILRGLGQLPVEQRAEPGKLANKVKVELEGHINVKSEMLAKLDVISKAKKEFLDVTLPGRKSLLGKTHPITQVAKDVCDIFIGLGFSIAEGPEIETDYYNFEALNIPKDHPARDMQDTFYLSEDVLLRTQTSPVQIHVMEKSTPPIRIIAPGKVFRRDSDITHSPMFHQVEGLLVDEKVTFGDLKGVLEFFVKRMFGPDVSIRFRPSFFPFTEPSAEVDIACVMCRGKGCRVCSETGWLEILGAGMVDPEVFKMVKYDPEKVSGYAFGMGVERIAMLKYGISDIRLFYENDLRFLEQF